jgi:phosphoribosylaminoimidazole-succinocarboxamide synthase
LKGIPGKGKILSQLSVFWFGLLGDDIIPNHFLTDRIDDMPDTDYGHAPDHDSQRFSLNP